TLVPPPKLRQGLPLLRCEGEADQCERGADLDERTEDVAGDTAQAAGDVPAEPSGQAKRHDDPGQPRQRAGVRRRATAGGDGAAVARLPRPSAVPASPSRCRPRVSRARLPIPRTAASSPAPPLRPSAAAITRAANAPSPAPTRGNHSTSAAPSSELRFARPTG